MTSNGEQGSGKTTFVRVVFPDETEWEIPTDIVATNRAATLASSDLERQLIDDYQAAYDEIYAETLGDLEEIHDWLFNNMNWSDVKHVAQKMKDRPKTVYDDAWGEAEAVRLVKR